MFRNFKTYSLSKDWAPSADDLESHLAARPYVKCGSNEAFGLGWIPQFDSEKYVLACGEFLFMTLAIETRTVPTSAINAELDAAIAKIEEQEGSKVGRKRKSDIAQQVALELLPKAFPKVRTVDVVIDPVNHWLWVCTTTDSLCETVLETMRRTLPEFPVSFFKTVNTMQATMKEWLLAGEATAGFTFGSTLHLKGEGMVRYENKDLKFDEITKHIEEGLAVERLELDFNERVFCTMNAAGGVRKLSFAKDVSDQVGSQQDGDAMQDFKATVIIEGQEVRAMMNTLLEVLGGHEGEEQSAAMAGHIAETDLAAAEA